MGENNIFYDFSQGVEEPVEVDNLRLPGANSVKSTHN